MVSFETAKALEAAGFPKPEHFRAGQHWYVDGLLSAIFSVDSDIEIYYATVCDFWQEHLDVRKYGHTHCRSPYDFMEDKPIFAPTTADILREFDKKHGGDLKISFNERKGRYFANEMTDRVRTKDGDIIVESDQVMDEVAAKAFLKADRTL